MFDTSVDPGLVRGVVGIHPMMQANMLLIKLFFFFPYGRLNKTSYMYTAGDAVTYIIDI